MAETTATGTFVVTAKQGLHIRPAEQLSRLANRYESQVELLYQNQRVDAKSIMEMLTLGAGQGASIEVEARGCDAQQAVEAIVALATNGFAVEQEEQPSESTSEQSSSS